MTQAARHMRDIEAHAFARMKLANSSGMVNAALPFMRAFRLALSMFAIITTARAADTVVLLHGLGRGPASMARLACALRAEGFEVRNLGYSSRRADIRTLADATLGPVFAAAREPGTRVHVVTHSMGGILLRQYLHDHGTPASLGRVVMLAPPNGGSELVDRLRTWSLYRRINGPAGLELGTDPASTPLALGALPAGAEVGVIAGNLSLNPFFSALISGADDGKVSVERTHVEGETAHLTVPHSHTWLMWRRPVLDAVRTFIHTGNFSPTPHQSYLSLNR